MNDNELVEGVTRWCARNGVKAGGVLVLTAQENRSTEYASLVVDMDRGKVLPNFPMELLTDYKETTCGTLLVCYKAGLALPMGYVTDASRHDAPDDGGPFGCAPSQLTPYKSTRTAYDTAFDNLTKGKGHHPNIVFEVKKQVDNGPLISTKYFALKHDTVTEVTGPFTQKMHAFKNYKCASANLFFAVDIYRADNTTGYNHHHMRLNPFTQINPGILRILFE
ncbi:hypothetical protein AB1Y20_007908 [Prymnesium parvum]|uniref:MABP domain-containing protein n=1 Tax=Prymnesium parvum TaxID=97485 RepID=A0AB34IS77_PRYPA|mmetsp:Transcript_21991/g.52821  ORF Transcript_21991/g.52821 Transcript_21991/m.52821 type:complete len:222 (-) Transcript_21991:470-1135(-)